MNNRKHNKHHVRNTSKKSYNEMKSSLSESQDVIYNYLKTVESPLTDREIARDLKFFDPNKVRPRRFELVEMELVKECPKRKCSVSGKTSLTWITN